MGMKNILNLENELSKMHVMKTALEDRVDLRQALRSIDPEKRFVGRCSGHRGFGAQPLPHQVFGTSFDLRTTM